MTEPVIAAQRLLAALVLGAGLGLWHGFLTPPRHRHPILADLLLVAAIFPTWL